MLVELTIRRSSPAPIRKSPVDGIRVLGLLPEEWRKDLKRISDDIVIQVRVPGSTEEAIRAEVAAVLANPEIGHLTLVTCAVLAPLP